jgi:hypothetical protein
MLRLSISTCGVGQEKSTFGREFRRWLVQLLQRVETLPHSTIDRVFFRFIQPRL